MLPPRPADLHRVLLLDGILSSRWGVIWDAVLRGVAGVARVGWLGGAALGILGCPTTPKAVIPAKAGIQYAAAIGSIIGASGILDHPPQCAIAHKPGDD